MIYDILGYTIKHSSIIQFLYRSIFSFLMKTVGVFVKTDPKLILFVSYGGKQFNDSPKVLFQAIQKDERFMNYKFVWAFEKPENYEIDNAQKVNINSLAYFITALKAKVWITNVNIERGLKFKKKETIYLNTWHGTGPKKSGNAVKKRNDYDFSNVDIFCCDGEYTRKIFKKWFNAIEENMIWCGRPREDKLFTLKPSDKERIKTTLDISQDKKIILYMPTWREYDEIEIDYFSWLSELQDDFIVLVRQHHFTKKIDSYNSKLNNFIYDVTDYSDVNELYYIADILISDFSSCFFDFALLEKPIVCFAPDYEKYEKCYGLFIDLKNDFPNGVFTDENDMLTFLKNMNYAEECKKTKEYCKKYIHREENATQICIDSIWGKINEKGY